jgi:hypothetical protein
VEDVFHPVEQACDLWIQVAMGVGDDADFHKRP